MKKEDRYLGRAVREGKLVFTSVTQIRLFDPSDDGCHRKWAYSYVFGTKLARTQALETGSDGAEKLEHYLTTGEDVLPPVLQPAKKFFPTPGKDLECEKYLGDMEKAIELRLKWLKMPAGDARRQVWAEMLLTAGLIASDVPIDGAADVRHRRGTYIDHDGNLREEAKGSYVINIDDLKMVSRIHPHTIRKGENAGKVLEAFVKTDAEVVDDVQMNAYGMHAVNIYPGMTHARLNLVYANKSKREAEKRMGIVSADSIVSRWRKTEDIVRVMEQTAGAQRIEDVPPNVRACDSFTHVDPTDPAGKRTLKGCGHRYYCPIAITEHVSMLGNYKESAMSLFDAVPPPPAPLDNTPTPPPPPVDAATHAAAVEEEKRKLAAFGNCRSCGATLGPSNTSKLQTGEVKHIGCPAAPGAAAPTPMTSSPVPPPPPISVNPPDRPQAPSDLELAGPVPPQEIAQITDPQLKAEVEDHARRHAERAAAEAKAAEDQKLAAQAAIWCPTSNQKIVISTEIAVARKFVCQCGKSYSLSVLKPVKEGGEHVSVIPRHKLPKKDGEQAAAPPPPPEKNISITVEGDDEDEDDAVIVSPVGGPPVPPPPAPPVVVPPPPPMTAPQVEQMITEGVQTSPLPIIEDRTNGTNGHAQPKVDLLGDVEVYRAETADGQIFSVLAASLNEALTKLDGHEVVAIELLPGPVLG